MSDGSVVADYLGIASVYSLEKDTYAWGKGNASGRTGYQFDIDKAVAFLDKNAYPQYDKENCGYCARAVRKALEAGGINTTGRPNLAKNYGQFLLNLGFKTVTSSNYSPVKGDIRVFQPYQGGNTAGHINMYNGSQWVSDFMENGF